MESEVQKKEKVEDRDLKVISLEIHLKPWGWMRVSAERAQMEKLKTAAGRPSALR